MLASGLQPTTLTLEPAVLTLLHLLSTPKSIEEIVGADLPIEPNERPPLVRLLLKVEAIESIRPQTTNEKAWWDPRDRAKYEASLLTLVQVAHGFSTSSQVGLCVDHWGRPLPWLARPVVEFLYQLDLSAVDVFEYGGGASTWYWSRRCRSVTCVESSEPWYERLRSELAAVATILLRTTAEEFADAIMELTRQYGVILIDAHPAFRGGCVRPALRRLAPGGMILLDDAPFYPEAAAELRSADLIEVDLTGYTPLEANLQTTSLFLSRGFDLPRRTKRSPAFPFGSPHFRWGAFRPDVNC